MTDHPQPREVLVEAIGVVASQESIATESVTDLPMQRQAPRRVFTEGVIEDDTTTKVP